MLFYPSRITHVISISHARVWSVDLNPQGDGGGSTGITDFAQNSVQMGAGFDVHDDNTGFPIGSLGHKANSALVAGDLLDPRTLAQRADPWLLPTQSSGWTFVQEVASTVQL